jgi:uncharacterized protein YndB with AHSA1/START domain
MEQGKIIPLNLTYHFLTDAERLFDAWVVPEIANQWYFKNETNIINLETDTKVSGKFLLREWDKGNIVDHFGNYLEIERPLKLVFTLEVPQHFKGVSIVSITIIQRQNESILRFKQEGIDTTSTKQAWEKMFSNLQRLLNPSGPPMRDK